MDWKHIFARRKTHKTLKVAIDLTEDKALIDLSDHDPKYEWTLKELLDALTAESEDAGLYRDEISERRLER